MSLHDDLLSMLQGVASVSLVASLRDSRLGFPAADDLRVFIPDLHILSREKRLRYRYGTNYLDLLTTVAQKLAQLKVGNPDSVVAVYQMGDFLDLWRETAVESDRIDAASRIEDDHLEFTRAILSPDLKARFLLGNHDFDLCRWANYTAWERRYYIAPQGTFQPTVVALHGDIFDWVEMIPQPINRFFVYFFSTTHAATDYALGEVQNLVAAKNARCDFTTQIAGVADLAGFASTSSPIPARLNVRSANNDDAAKAAHEFLPAARATCRGANANFGLNLRLAIIGHTHHARIAEWDTGTESEYFVLVDTGAWIEQCTVSGVIQPNAQITALSANELRIYQLAPRV